MRNFFKDTLAKNPFVNRKQIIELLGTGEEKVITQYKNCLKYISRVKNDALQKSESFLQNKKHLLTR